MQNGMESMKGAAKDAFKSGLGHLASGSGCLQMFHFFLAFITIIGLNMTDISRDLKDSQDRLELPGFDGCKDVLRNEGMSYFLCRFYCVGTVWSIIVGLIGLLSMCILVANIIIPMPKKLMVVYYFVSCFAIFIIALIGVCYNYPVEMFFYCLEKTMTSDCNYASIENKLPMRAPITKESSAYFLMFAISCIHATSYFFSGLIEVAKPSDGNSPRYSQDSTQYVQDQQAQPQEEQQQWTQEQLQQYAQSQAQQPQQWDQPQGQQQHIPT